MLSPVYHGLLGECRKHAAAKSLESVLFWAAARGGVDRTSADATPLPHQTPVLDLLRSGAGDPGQWRIPRAQRTGGALEKAGTDPGPELELQSRVEGSIQGRHHRSQRARGEVFHEFYLGLLHKGMRRRWHG